MPVMPVAKTEVAKARRRDSAKIPLAFASGSIGIRGANREVPLWGIRRRRKRGERVNRSKQWTEAPAIPAAPTEIAGVRRRDSNKKITCYCR